jgi:hypothetical protein
MMGQAMAKKVFGGAVGAVGLAVGLVRHLAWYVGYQVDGKARESDAPDRKS